MNCALSKSICAAVASACRIRPFVAFNDPAACMFGERMCLYWSRASVFLKASKIQVRECDYVGLAFHSPNMEATHRFNLLRKATVVSQDAVATLILSGRYIGFLPDHYVASFVRDRTIKRIDIPESTYEVRYVAISRRSPTPPRLSTVFLDLLKQAHGRAQPCPCEGNAHPGPIFAD